MRELRERAIRVLLEIAEDQSVGDENRIAAASQAIYGTADNQEAVDYIAAGVAERLREVA
jgi:hypothetical protein